VLDPKLKNDCYMLGTIDGSYLLLMKNAMFPWYVLVPDTDEIELHNLSAQLQSKVLRQINFVSKFIEGNNRTDKINIGAIGNIVPQLHIHIIGRSIDDICWPGVVWGTKEFREYQPGKFEEIKEKFSLFLKEKYIQECDKAAPS